LGIICAILYGQFQLQARKDTNQHHEPPVLKNSVPKVMHEGFSFRNANYST
jgi:hypothetical protein